MFILCRGENIRECHLQPCLPRLVSLSDDRDFSQKQVGKKFGAMVGVNFEGNGIRWGLVE